ncbi:hypothetical protein Fot_48481 [Forsythia ovata]|uniref:Uncharacterized protein n=1 Tax=Forsythia ovata TaxID=205694 RepID=A0ABD1Q952_9LAMI
MENELFVTGELVEIPLSTSFGQIHKLNQFSDFLHFHSSSPTPRLHRQPLFRPSSASSLRHRCLATSPLLLGHLEFSAASLLPLVDKWWKIHNGWRDTRRKILSVWRDVTKWSVRLLLRREDRSRPSLGRNWVECD